MWSGVEWNGVEWSGVEWKWNALGNDDAGILGASQK
jgi:hypothetical protein